MRIATLAALVERAPSALPEEIWQVLKPPPVLDAFLDLAGVLVPCLPAEEVTAVLELVGTVPDRLKRARRLLALAPHLPQEERSRLVEPVLSVIASREHTDPDPVIDLAEEALVSFPGHEQELLKAVYRVRDRELKLNALVNVAERLDEADSRSVWLAALKTAKGYSAARDRARALEWLTRRLPKDHHSDLLHAATSVNEWGQTCICLAVAPRLTRDQRELWLRHVMTMEPKQEKIAALGALLKYGDEGQRSQITEAVFSELATDLHSLEAGWMFAAVTELSSYDNSMARVPRAQMALEWAQQRPTPVERTDALAMLAAAAPSRVAGQAALAALATAIDVDDAELPSAIQALGSFLPVEHLDLVVQLAESAIGRLDDHKDNLTIRLVIGIRDLSVVAKRAVSGRKYDTALHALRLLHRFDREETIIHVLPLLPVSVAVDLVSLAERQSTLGEIALHLGRRCDWTGAMAAVRAVLDQNKHGSSSSDLPGPPIAELVNLAPRRLLHDLLDCIQELPASARAVAFPPLFRRLSLRERRTRLEAAWSTENAEVLLALAPLTSCLRTKQLLATWRKTLRRAENLPSAEALRHIRSLADPVIQRLGPETSLAIWQAARDVDRWWSLARAGEAQPSTPS